MHAPDFWTCDADAMELTIEGNRLIVREVSEWMRAAWGRISQRLARLQSLAMPRFFSRT
jgi:hypothetical protein